MDKEVYELDKITTIRMRKRTKERLKPYKNTYGTYERAILELIKNFEGESE
ncbi:MAG: hypothetical protein AABY22_02970 [Nanoarchaeota archaeon]